MVVKGVNFFSKKCRFQREYIYYASACAQKGVFGFEFGTFNSWALKGYEKAISVAFDVLKGTSILLGGLLTHVLKGRDSFFLLLI